MRWSSPAWNRYMPRHPKHSLIQRECFLSFHSFLNHIVLYRSKMFTRHTYSALYIILTYYSLLFCCFDTVLALSVGDVDRSCGSSSSSSSSSQGIRPQTACITVQQWTDFSNAIAQHASLATTTTANHTTSPISSLVFCPFTAINPPTSSSTVEISHSISIVCQQEHKCILDSSKTGGNTLVRIKGPQAKVHFQGFIFQGAGLNFSAVHIAYGVIQTQSFCNCIFQRYVDYITQSIFYILRHRIWSTLCQLWTLLSS